jgi:hypothetical protein
VPVWFLVGPRVHQIRLLGAILASQVCGVLSDEVLVGCDTTVVATFRCSSGVARAVRWMLSGWMRLSARLRLLSVRQGTGLTGRGSAPSAGGSLSRAAGWFRATTW